MNHSYNTQNNLLYENLITFYKNDNNLDKFVSIITGESIVSLRIVDWFATNYAKKFYTTYTIAETGKRFKVYIDYKLKLKSFRKKRFDAFCRFERLTIPYKNGYIETTLGQMNFFEWAIKNKVIDYIEKNYTDIERDMNSRNTITNTSKKIKVNSTVFDNDNNEIVGNSGSVVSIGCQNDKKTRKKRHELSCSATKTIKKEDIEIVLSFA